MNTGRLFLCILVLGFVLVLGCTHRPTGPASKSSTKLSEPARLSKENAEILAEMYRVVFLRAPTNRVEFGQYVASLNDGTSLDGIHNGFTHSLAYQKLEKLSSKPTALAFQYFVSEFRMAYGEMEAAPVLSPDFAKPFELTIEGAYRELSESHSQDVIEFKKIRANATRTSELGKLPSEVLDVRLNELFKNSSAFTLKRVLATLLLDLIDEKLKLGPEVLANWYAAFVVRAAALKVDFGLPQRNLADREFHNKWALKANSQRLRWEVLNRVHRILNPAT